MLRGLHVSRNIARGWGSKPSELAAHEQQAQRRLAWKCVQHMYHNQHVLFCIVDSGPAVRPAAVAVGPFCAVLCGCRLAWQGHMWPWMVRAPWALL